MQSKVKVIGATIGGAAVLASGAYALGAQSGGGEAEAAKARAAQTQTAPGYGGPAANDPNDPKCRPGGRRGGPGGPAGAGLSDLAKKLGVSEAKLRSAFQAVRKDQRDDRKDKADAAREAFATALAKELGISKDKVLDALPKGSAGGPGFHGPHMGRGAPGAPPAGAPPAGAPGGYGTP